MRRGSLPSLLVLALLPAAAQGFSGGAFGLSQTGCGAGSACHSIVAAPTTRVCIDGLPADRTYVPGAVYDLEVFVDGLGVPPAGAVTGGRVAGFALGASAGSLEPVDGTVFGVGSEVTHGGPAAIERNHWRVRWTAPAAGSAALVLSGNAVNASGNQDAGDLWNQVEAALIAGTGGSGPGLACNPDLPLPQLLRLPPESGAMPAHGGRR